MKAFSPLSLLAAVILAAGLLTAGRSADDKDKGWVPLFNGKNLDGWIQRGGKAKYRVEGKDIVGTTIPNTPNSFLCTKKDYADFILELDFKVNPKLNSGVQIRSQCFDTDKTLELNGKKIKVPAGRVHGYQVEIDATPRLWSGGIHDEARRGWLGGFVNLEASQKAFKQNDWNHFRIECKGNSIKTALNGVPTAALKDSVTPSGFIALQVHGVGKLADPLEVRWRNIRIKELK